LESCYEIASRLLQSCLTSIAIQHIGFIRGTHICAECGFEKQTQHDPIRYGGSALQRTDAEHAQHVRRLCFEKEDFGGFYGVAVKN
jgi:hypothetical protein